MALCSTAEQGASKALEQARIGGHGGRGGMALPAASISSIKRRICQFSQPARFNELPRAISFQFAWSLASKRNEIRTWHSTGKQALATSGCFLGSQRLPLNDSAIATRHVNR